jgi:hypothetical protein
VRAGEQHSFLRHRPAGCTRARAYSDDLWTDLRTMDEGSRVASGICWRSGRREDRNEYLSVGTGNRAPVVVQFDFHLQLLQCSKVEAHRN